MFDRFWKPITFPKRFSVRTTRPWTLTRASLRVAEELDLVHEVEQRLHGVEVNDVRVGGGQRVQVGRERRAGVQRVLGERLADLGAS